MGNDKCPPVNCITSSCIFFILLLSLLMLGDRLDFEELAASLSYLLEILISSVFDR